MTGTTLHSVSRYLSKWERLGIIGGERRRVVVHRPKDLPVKTEPLLRPRLCQLGEGVRQFVMSLSAVPSPGVCKFAMCSLRQSAD